MKSRFQLKADISLVSLFLYELAILAGSTMAQGLARVEGSRSCTHQLFEDKNWICVGNAPVYQPGIKLKMHQLSHNAPEKIGISQQQAEIDLYLPPARHLAIQFDHQNGRLNFKYPILDNPFSKAVQAAIAKAPQWMKNDLMNVFSFLNFQYQEKWANAILDARDPYIDEIAFCIANLSPQYLMSSYASVQLLKDNAKLVYQNDQFLDYVKVIDYGSSQTDPNYYSTTRYRKAKYLDTVAVEVPRDLYYWYVVHPKISDEIPAYIDPEVIENNYSHNNNISDSEHGYFWRDFLFNHADPGYAKLQDLLKGCKVVRNQFNGSVSLGTEAMAILNRWLDRSMQFTSNDERPHQPVRIYRKHIGRCGENSDLRVAIARSALIPATGVTSASTDHVWNEFWDEEWIHWDGVMDDPFMYVNSWGKKFGSVFRWRSDGSLTSVTAKYTKSHSKLDIYALDSLGNAIDGARVVLYTTGLDGNLWFDNYSCTDNDGKVSFIVGTDRQYYARMSCDYGNVPSGSNNLLRVVSNSRAGEEYSVSLAIAAAKPIPAWQDIPVPQFQNNRYYLEIDVKVPYQIIRGTDLFDDLEKNAYQFIQNTDGKMNYFITDETNYQGFITGQEFMGFHSFYQSDSVSLGFEFDDQLDWYYVFDNSNSLYNLQHLVGSVTLYNISDPVIPKVFILQNYPNPVKVATTISYKLPEKTKVELSIYNVLGQRVTTLVNGTKYAGQFSVDWDGRDESNQLVSSGVYLCKIKTDIGGASRKMLLIR